MEKLSPRLLNWASILEDKTREQASAGRGYDFLCDVRPWLLLKAEQADVAIAWWAQREGPRRGPAGRMLPLTAEARAADEAAQLTLRELKLA